MNEVVTLFKDVKHIGENVGSRSQSRGIAPLPLFGSRNTGLHHTFSDSLGDQNVQQNTRSPDANATGRG